MDFSVISTQLVKELCIVLINDYLPIWRKKKKQKNNSCRTRDKPQRNALFLSHALSARAFISVPRGTLARIAFSPDGTHERLRLIASRDFGEKLHCTRAREMNESTWMRFVVKQILPNVLRGERDRGRERGFWGKIDRAGQGLSEVPIVRVRVMGFRIIRDFRLFFGTVHSLLFIYLRKLNGKNYV